MKLWLDAQLSPEMAAWIVRNFAIEAVPVRDMGLKNASDLQIFEAAKHAGVVLITKDSDFSDLIARFGSPPQVIWVRCGFCCFVLVFLAFGCVWIVFGFVWIGFGLCLDWLLSKRTK